MCSKKGLRIYLSEPPGGPSRQMRQVGLGAANGPRVASHHRHLMGIEEKVSMKIKRPVYTVGSADEPLPSAPEEPRDQQEAEHPARLSIRLKESSTTHNTQRKLAVKLKQIRHHKILCNAPLRRPNKRLE